jgi:tRNA threonylcarbamoyl adenosine modification protein YeaZ
MWILGLDFSSPQRSVALVQATDDCKIAGAGTRCVHEVVEASGHGGRAVGMIDDVLQSARIEREQIQRIAIGLGPGSYSGIRSSIAIAQGWSLARETPLSGVSSVENLAAVAVGRGITGRIAIVINAQRNEFYLARYELESGAHRSIQALKIVSMDAVIECRDAGDVLLGPEITTWFPHGTVLHPSASMAARLAMVRGESVPGEALEPIYLRETQFVKAPAPRFGSKPDDQEERAAGESF